MKQSHANFMLKIRMKLQLYNLESYIVLEKGTTFIIYLIV